MSAIVDIYSEKPNEIKNFVDKFYESNVLLANELKHEIIFENPVEVSNIISAFVDNKDKFDIYMWVCLDKGVFVNITENNANKIIKYLFERYPY